jgi:hypothetical protein
MRRAIAVSLLTIFSWMLIAPLFAPDAEASLPPCCRRHGRHHCMMQMMQAMNGALGGPARASEPCPCWPKGGGAVASRLFKPEAGRLVPAELVWSAPLLERSQVRRQSAFLDSHPKRGPPDPVA